VLVIWLALIAFSVATGLLNVALGWNGLALSIGGLALSVTVYPPFVVAVLLALVLGPMWGMVPLYLANLTSALASGMSVLTGAVFALAGPLEIAILWGSMVLLGVRPGLSTCRDRVLFGFLGLIAPTASSLATPLWNAAHQLDLLQGQQVWRGWVVGDLLQLILIAGPALYWGHNRAQKWLQNQLSAAPQPAPSYRTALPVVVSVFVMLGILMSLGVSHLAATLGISPEARTETGELLTQRLTEILVFLGVLFVVLLITTVLFTLALARRGESEHEVAQRDGLTGCFNRRAFKELFAAESARNARLALPLSVMVLDADDFKGINDRHGHEVGDRALWSLARRVQGVIRETDYLFRWGGDEFVLLLPHTDPEHARNLAERIRSDVAGSPLLNDDGAGPVRLTMSIGVTGRLSPPFEERSMLLLADQAMYQAKRQGSNRVELGL
jgi:diguanylate cyclase (GGDEF)-like protein